MRGAQEDSFVSPPDDGVATFTRPREAVGREMESSGPGGAIPILPKHSLSGASTPLHVWWRDLDSP